ncbi:MAG: lasso RiPP family leader peptide-containing protein [Thiobacillus sp.]|nr:lasso RiPP family leader peptide-containing protein [Thiobacillus sp.]
MDQTARVSKRMYHPPSLTRYGALRELTQAGSGKNKENVNNCIKGTANIKRQRTC